MTNFTESVVEDAALAWLESLGYTIKHGPEIAPAELLAERTDYGQVVLAGRLHQALAKLNPTLPVEAIEDAFRKITRLEGATLDGRNRAFHRLLVDGVTVEYRTDGSIRGAQARLLDFDNPDNNGWLAVNQFTVVENKHNRRRMLLFSSTGCRWPSSSLKTPPMKMRRSGTPFNNCKLIRRRFRRYSHTTRRC